MAARCHVLMFVSHLGGGGAEKHLVRIANHLDRSRFRVSLVLLRGGGAYQGELSQDIRVHVLDGGMRFAAFALAGVIARERPDVVFSVMDAANCMALCAASWVRPSPPVVVGIQFPVTIELAQDLSLSRTFMKAAIPVLYPRADRIVALSRGVRDDLKRWLPALGPATHVIHNAGFDDRVLEQAEAPIEVPPHLREGPILVACGRLTAQKGFDVLLDALVLVRERIPAKLWILGEGPLRDVLQAQAGSLGLAPHVWFGGFRTNPYAYMRRADVFVLSSVNEGFANVIVEAMAVGTPVVSTDCPYGPSEIIRGEPEGVLVPVGDAPALAAAVVRLLGDQARRGTMAEAGKRRALDFFAPRIAAEYAEIFATAVRRQG